MEDIFGTEVLQNKESKKKRSFSMLFYSEDYDVWQKIKEHNIFEERKIDYSNTIMVKEGIELLKEKYSDISPRDGDFKLRKGGRRNNDYEVVNSSAFISKEDYEFYQDFLYYKIYTQKNLNYFTYDFTREIIELLLKKYELIR